jgi:DNA polymerase-3 subunit delta'
MIDRLVLHHATRGQLQSFLARPSHALLLTGPAGIGKTAIAEALTEGMLGASLSSHPYYLAVRPDGSSISIDAIRQMQKFLQLKTTGEKPFRRAVIVEYAHALTTEAQNAFLKLLEEPPADTVMILTANNPRALLPTILSRTQTITVNAPDEAQLKPILDSSNKSDAERKQAYFLSGGLPGLLHALLRDEEEHPLLTSVTQAKELLQKPTFERVAMADALSKQKEAALGLVDALERIARAGLNGAASKQDSARLKQWHRLRKESLEAKSALRHNTNAKLVLTNLFINL